MSIRRPVVDRSTASVLSFLPEDSGDGSFASANNVVSDAIESRKRKRGDSTMPVVKTDQSDCIK